MLLKNTHKNCKHNNDIHDKIILLLDLGRIPKKNEVFYELTLRANSKLKKLLEDYYSINLSESDRDLVKNLIKLNPMDFCNSCSLVQTTIDYNDSTKENSLKIIEKLFEYFFKDVLELKIHYDSLKILICPYCTIKDFTSFDGNYREAYDHFFPISKYPYWGADMRNLSPMCDVCNSRVKGSRDPIYDDSGKRQEILTPYQNLYKFEVKTVKIISNKPEIKILCIEGTNNNFDNFITFFKLQERFEAEFKSTSSTWYGYLERDYVKNKFNDLQTFQNIVQNYIEEAEKRKFTETSKFLEKSYYEYVYKNPEKFYHAITC